MIEKLKRIAQERAICPVICLAGPTGCGKTALAVRLARQIGGEIINADSRQVYSQFPIITAQPTREERGGITHHLYGIISVAEKIDAASWATLAAARAAEIFERNLIPILVGGTGFYFRALLEGIAPIPVVPEEVSRKIRNRLAECGPNALYGELREIDSLYAAKIHKNDRQRIARALEVYMATGQPPSFWHGAPREGYGCAGPLLVMDVKLAQLEPCLAERIDAMLTAGAREEALRAERDFPNLSAPGWQGIGCRELAAFNAGRINLEECREKWFRGTRAYAKRQLTWFRGRNNAIFTSVGNLDEIIGIINKFFEFEGKAANPYCRGPN